VLEKALGEVFGLLATSLHSVWGRVAPNRRRCCRGCVGVGEQRSGGTLYHLTATRSAPASSHNQTRQWGKHADLVPGSSGVAALFAGMHQPSVSGIIVSAGRDGTLSSRRH
jgi:hypothetical protein